MSQNNRAFDHIVVIMFENQYRGYVMENPYFRQLAKRGIDLANSFGVMHPSQTNYIASIAGQLCGVTDDDQPPPLPQDTIVDLLEAAGLQWKAYMDGYAPEASPWSPDLKPADQYPYVIKHDPFSSFENIIRSQPRWERIVSEAQFWIDLRNNALPEYAWFTPDMWNDGHYIRGTHTEPKERAPALVDQAADWLRWFFQTLNFPGPKSLFPPRTLVVVTFDEADFEAAWDAGKKYTYDGPNQIYTALLGDVVEPGVEQEGYNHYSLLKTIEKNFSLGSLNTNDEGSNWLRFLWGERFAWGDSNETPIAAGGAAAAASIGDDLIAVWDGGAQGLVWRSWNGGWSEVGTVGKPSAAGLAAAALGDALFLAMQTDSGIEVVTYRPSTGWNSQSETLSSEAASALALTPCRGGADLMLAYSTADGRIRSRRFRGGAWEAEVDTGHQTDGPLCLSALGACLLLVFKTPGRDEMTAVSYNTADFNAIQVPEGKYAGAYDDTTKDAWSPSGHPVLHFAAASSPVTPGEMEPELRPYQAGAPLAMGELDGAIHLLHPPVHGSELTTETFSIPGVLTPKMPVSYRAGDATTTSNGYGTLAEAGWSRQSRLEGVAQERGRALVVARRGKELCLLHQPDAGGPLHLCRGGYRQK